MSLYTPFFERSMGKVTQAHEQNIVGKLAKSAYMGDPNALGELYRFNPEMARQIETQKNQNAQADLSRAATEQSMGNNKMQMDIQLQQIGQQIIEKAAAAPDYATAQGIIANEIGAYRNQGINIPQEMSAETFTPEMFQQIKQAYTRPAGLQKLSEGDTLYDPNTQQPVFTAPKAPVRDTQRESRIANIAAQLQETLDLSSQEAAIEAANIADGNITIEILESGQARRINKLDSTVSEIPVRGSGQEIPVPEPGNTLFDLADVGTGPVSAARAGLARVGLDSGETLTARTQIRSTMQEYARAMASNPRFAVAEIERIRKDSDLDPSFFDTPEAYRARLVGFDNYAATRQAQAERDASDPSLSADIREAQSTNAAMLRNMRALAGVPKQVDFLNTPEDVATIDTPSLRYFAENANDEVLNALPDEVVEAIIKKLGSQK